MNRDKHADAAALMEWQPTVSGNAGLKLSAGVAAGAQVLRMDFDFKGGGGFVVARREFSRAMPSEYAVNFRLRGRGPVNNLELKLVDATRQNVWRHVIKDLKLPARWKRMSIVSRDIDFAWGPSSGRGIVQLGALEFAIVAGEGGHGTVWIADIDIADCSPTEDPRAGASSGCAGFDASKALNGCGWRPLPQDPRPWIVIDSIRPRTMGGLVIDWLEEAPADGFRIRVSNTGLRWKTVYTARKAGGKRTNVYLPDMKTRYLRLELAEPSAGASLSLQSSEFSRSIDAFWHNVADAESRGWHPRWLHREQSTWTPIGTSNGTYCALMNDDGMVEMGEGSPSIEPMLLIDGRLVTWAEVTPRQELQNEWVPVPSVVWQTAAWRLRIEAEATVNHGLRVRYLVENLTDEASTVHLFVLVRPFQVTPPWQHFRKLGGVSPIVDLEWRDGEVRVNGSLAIAPVTAPTAFGCMGFDDGFIASRLLAGTVPPDTVVHDTFGYATGVLDFKLSLGPHERCERAMNCTALSAAREPGDPVFDWRSGLPVTQWSGNGWIMDVINAALTATAHVLVTRSGPALQPGPRRYTRSWIRDGAMMSAALLRMGRTEEVRVFIRWYAPHQRADGFVPCCVDSEGIDWLVEHDSHGQLIALIADYYRFTSDLEFLREVWTFVVKAVSCIENLLGEGGLLPVSVSHEGYLAQPVHSYWDDFWALRGLRDSVSLARAMNQEDSAHRWDMLAKRLGASLFASIEATRAERGLDFIPGSIEWADFDPTATANALYLFDVPDGLNRKAVERTFDAYYTEWRGKRSGAVVSQSYTPYEIRIIGAFVRLGRRGEALALLKFFLADRRPPAWNQWPEIAWRDTRAPAHIGDLPHTWIAAEYVLAVRSLFAYEREPDQSLVLAAGLSSEWIEGPGVRVNAMPTLHGNLSYSLRRMDAKTVRFEIAGGIDGTVILRPPLYAPIRTVMQDGGEFANFDGESVTILNTPALLTYTSF